MRAPLSVVIPTRDRVALLTGCLAALQAELGDGDEILVVDSDSVGREQVAAAAARAGVRLVRCEQRGASRARNAGWRAASHDLIAFIDDDVRVRAGWADALVAGFDDSAVAFLTGGVVVPEHQRAAERPVAISYRTAPTPLHPDLEGDLGASANAAVRRQAIAAIGGFDETLGPGTWAASAEDLDLYDRLFRANYRGLFEPAASAEHDQWRTKPQLLALDWRYGKGMGVRLGRMLRWDRPRARRLLWEALVTQGMRYVVKDLASGYEFGAAAVTVRTLGTMLGVVVGVAKGPGS